MAQWWRSSPMWASTDAIDYWRSVDGWRERVGAIRNLLDRFEPATLEAVVELDE